MTTKWYAVHETETTQARLLIPSRKHNYHASRQAAERSLIRFNARLGFLSLANNRGLIWSSDTPNALNNQEWGHVFTIAL